MSIRCSRVCIDCTDQKCELGNSGVGDINGVAVEITKEKITKEKMGGKKKTKQKTKIQLLTRPKLHETSQDQS